MLDIEFWTDNSFHLALLFSWFLMRNLLSFYLLFLFSNALLLSDS